MKKIALIILCLSFHISFSQEIDQKIINSEISEVTVFIKGAQIIRKKTVELKKGKTILKFSNLSPFINSKSIQVKVNGNVTVLSVNHQQNFIDKLEKQDALVKLETDLEKTKDDLKLEETYLEILKEELSFLQENRNIGGKNEELSVTNLKEASVFYSSKLTALKLKEIDRNKNLASLRKKEFEIQNQIKTMTSKKAYANGEILVKVESKNASKSNFEISYVVGNAGWLPTYDIRAKNVNEPVELVYKANIKQDTKIDWKNVKLSLSSADPNLSGVAPELKTYYLNYNTAPPSYNRSINQVTGKVLDNDSQPLPGVNVIVKGTTIGTTTDFDGNYAITIPETSSQLEFTYLGFESQVLNTKKPIHNIRLNEDILELEEVVVVGYGASKKRSVSDQLQGRVTGVNIRGASSTSIPLVQVENQTTVNFKIELPYTIASDNKSYAVNMVSYNLPAEYQYFSVPKIEKEAFLIASIKDWEQYNLLEGEANIFFEGTYVGKTILDVKYASDSLEISLGRDKNVVVDRQKVSDFSSKKLIGSKKEENRDWTISVKNNKSETINMLIMDQIPVSTLDEIKVELSELSKGKHNLETGEIQWQFNLEPNKTKNIDLKYSVKYPKSRNLIIE
ncbi:mucoidy inhibitor MuiA family protein [Formosa sp. L2A11]|uniref:mucoidy inhibitor MuiA family protein n=1 Tax=Formosa sp. L2A11 TaxID=2686363 RepID=UPI00131A96D2|nr:mucoidy inhibitor MuiA family protein [Formosa sp. L2A11]